MNFIKNNDVRMALAPVATGTSAVSTAIIDTNGYTGVTFITTATANVATAVLGMVVEQSDANSTAGMSALAGASATATGTSQNDLKDKIMIVEVDKPLKRYVQATFARTVAASTLGATIAVLHGVKKAPVVLHTSVADAALAVEPAEA